MAVLSSGESADLGTGKTDITGKEAEGAEAVLHFGGGGIDLNVTLSEGQVLTATIDQQEWKLTNNGPGDLIYKTT